MSTPPKDYTAVVALAITLTAIVLMCWIASLHP